MRLLISNILRRFSVCKGKLLSLRCYPRDLYHHSSNHISGGAKCRLLTKRRPRHCASLKPVMPCLKDLDGRMKYFKGHLGSYRSLSFLRKKIIIFRPESDGLTVTPFPAVWDQLWDQDEDYHETWIIRSSFVYIAVELVSLKNWTSVKSGLLGLSQFCGCDAASNLRAY